MPLAKIRVFEGRYDEARIAKVSGAVQAALMNTLRVPAEDFYQLIFELPKNRFLHHAIVRWHPLHRRPDHS
jgi:phenylpyruvate tautomerase PptA (4-oxalocrotonate tautomerase family)